MNIKEELKQAKQHVSYHKDKGEEFEKIVLTLNMTFEGFYYARKGVIYRDNPVDYLPDIVIS